MKKRFFAALMCLCLLLTLMPTTAFAAGTGAIQLVDSTSNPTGGISGYTASGYHYVYYGVNGSTPIKWRVLDDQTNTGETGLFLLSEDLLGTGTFGGVYFDNTSPYSNAWQGSDAQGWCKDFAGESGASTNVSDAFTGNELAAILATTKGDDSFTSSTYSVPFAAATDILSGDKVFFLSAKEAENSDYGFTNDSSRIANYTGSAGVWWLRSPFADFDYDAGVVYLVGRVLYSNVPSDWAARPAFNLNLNSVLFTSAAVGGKIPAAAGGGAIFEISSTTPTEWKLTLLDSDRHFAAATTAVNGDVLTVTYSGATTGTNEYISAIVKDNSGNITRYGRLKNTTAAADASGTVNIDLSGVTMAATDTLYVFSEQYNGGANDDTKLTDYASALVEVSQTKNAYAITKTLTNITSDNTSIYRLSSDTTTNYTATLSADTNYTLPASITVKVGVSTLTAGTDYTYDSTNGALTIYAASITGDIEITAAGVAPHSHSWATTWATNATHHWHECEGAGTCDITADSAKDNYGTHTAGDWVIDTNATASTNGSKHKECTVCGYVMETATIPATGGGSSDPTYFYTLTFDTNGGSSISTARISEYATVDLTLSKYIPTREGYEFTGWYSDKALTAKITSIRLTKNTTIYAGWKTTHENPRTGIDNPFTDVKESDWFFDDVMFVYGNKLMLGTSATTFSPGDTTTRAMVATILWRMEGSPKVTGSSGFTDVSDGKYYTDAVTWAKQNDIVKGYSNTLFGPNDPVTREQLAAFFYSYAQYKGYDTTISGSISSFKDKDKVSDWAVDAMKWAVGYGVIQGKTGNLLDPQGDATRAQLAAMLHRLIEKNGLVEGVTPTGLMGWINPKGLDIPKTGDDANAAFFSGMFMLSAMALVALLYLRKRKNGGNDPTSTAA